MYGGGNISDMRQSIILSDSIKMIVSCGVGFATGWKFQLFNTTWPHLIYSIIINNILSNQRFQCESIFN